MIAWLGNFFLIVYYWRIAKKHRDALLFAAGGQIAYTAWGLMASPKLWAVVFLDLLCSVAPSKFPWLCGCAVQFSSGCHIRTRTV